MAGGVNLLSVQTRDTAKMAGFRRMITSLATVLLVTYVVIVSAVTGWWFFLADRQEKLSAQVIALTADIGQLAPVEVLLRQQEHRVDLIESTWQTRKSVAGVMTKLIDTASAVEPEATLAAQVVGLDYREGKQAVEVAVPDAKVAEKYVWGLRQHFGGLTMDTLNRQSPDLWLATISWLGDTPAPVDNATP